MSKTNLTISVDNMVINAIRIRGDLQGKISNMVNEFLKTVINDISNKDEQELINEISRNQKDLEELQRKLALSQSKLLILKEKTEFEAEEKLKEQIKFVDTWRLNRLNEFKKS